MACVSAYAYLVISFYAPCRLFSALKSLLPFSLKTPTDLGLSLLILCPQLDTRVTIQRVVLYPFLFSHR